MATFTIEVSDSEQYILEVNTSTADQFTKTSAQDKFFLEISQDTDGTVETTKNIIEITTALDSQASSITIEQVNDINLVVNTDFAIDHPTISAASSVDNSGNYFIQDLLFDRYGHVTGISSSAVTGSLAVSEADPIFTASVAYHISADDTGNWTASYNWITSNSGNIIYSGNNISLLNNDAGYITGYTETDPVFSSSPANTISTGDISNWNNAYVWGDHSISGYLVSGDYIGYLNNSGLYALSGSHIAVNAASNSDNSGSVFIQDILLDEYGHVTGINTALSSGIGVDTNDYVISATFNSGNSNLVLTRTDGGTITGVLSGVLISGTNYHIPVNGTGVNQSGRTYVQDILVDAYGHITGVVTATETVVDTNTEYTNGVGISLSGTVFSIDDTVIQSGDNISLLNNDAGYISGYTEIDPIFTGHITYNISSGDISNWNVSYGWGDHSTSGYATTGYVNSVSGYIQDQIDSLPSDTNTFVTGVSYSSSTHELVLIRNSGSVTGILNDIVHSGDNISLLVNDSGYINSETDPVFTGSAAYNITTGNISNWNEAYSWGDHSLSGYITGHPIINAASSSDNSGRIYIQDILLDGYGHITGLATSTETGIDIFVTGIIYNSTDHSLVLARNIGSVTGILDDVVHSGDNISILYNDKGYITGYVETGLNTFVTGIEYNSINNNLILSRNDSQSITGVLQGVVNTGNAYANPSWITSIDVNILSGIINSSNLPSYVDDVLEYTTTGSFPATGESGKIYLETTNNRSYRWGGSTYIQIVDGKATWGGIDGSLSNQTDLWNYLQTGHISTNATGSVNNSGRTYIQDIFIDSYGHVTGLSSSTETVTDTFVTGISFNPLDKSLILTTQNNSATGDLTDVIISGDNISLLVNDVGYITSGQLTGLNNIVEDLTPQFGGFLDLNGQNITGTGNIAISGNITAYTGNFDVISFNVDDESILTKGQISWDDTEGTMDIGLTDNTTIHIGSHRYFRIRNETGGTLYKGQVVYASGVHANGIIEPALYVADGTVREVRFMGVVLEDVNHQNNGYAIDFGHLEEMDLDGSATNYAVGDETWSAGDILYVHPTVAGKLTKNEPKHSISVAIILDVGNGNGNGRMFVRPTSYGHLDDNHDVAVSGATNGQFLQYNSATDYWVPSSSGNFTTLLVNGTPVPTGVGTSNYVTKWTGTNSIGNSLIYDNGTNVGIGTSSPSYTLDVSGNIQAYGSYAKIRTLDGSVVNRLQSSNFDSVGYIGTESNHDLIIRTNNLDRAIVDNSGNVGIGTSSPTEKLDVNGSIKTRTGGVGHEDNGCYIAYPGGGTLRSGTATQTGYLKITLPVSWTNTMIQFELDLYEYSTGLIKKFRIGGYNYSVSSGWLNPSVMIDSDNDSTKYRVHFGHDGTYCAIYISKINSSNIDLGASSTWSHSQGSISNFFGGWGGVTMANWADGWSIGFTTTLGTISTTRESSRPYRQHDTSYVFNEYGGNVDFRVEGDTDTNLLFTDASADRVGIGTNTPSAKLMVYATGVSSFRLESASSYAYSMIKHNSSTQWGYLEFNNDSSNKAFVQQNGSVTSNWGGPNALSMYNYAGPIVFGTNTTNSYIERMSIDTSGNIVINEGGLNSDFRVEGDTDPNLLFVNASHDNIAIGTNSPLDSVKFQIRNEGDNAKTYTQLISGANKGFGLLNNQTVLETIGAVHGFYSYVSSANNGNVTNMYHFRTDPPSGVGTITNQSAFYAGAGLAYATNNYGFHGYVPLGTNNYNIYMESSAKNYFNGDVGIGTPSPSAKLQVEGGNVVFNDNGGNYDFRVEGDSDPNLLRTDASSDHVGIGVESPFAKLHVRGPYEAGARYNLLVDDSSALATGIGGSIVFGGLYNSSGSYTDFAEIKSFRETDQEDDARSSLIFSNYGSNGLFSSKMIINSSGNVGIGTSSPSEKLDVNGSIRTRTGGIGHEDEGCYIAYPGGGTYNDSSVTQTGYLKITLPVSWTSTMLAFDIDIYEYTTQKIKKFRVGGYNWTGGATPQWVNTSAMMDSDNDFAKYVVRFGHDGTKCAIYISEKDSNNIDLGSSTTWNYCKVSVSNFFGGWSNMTLANWADGWDVGFTTTLGTAGGTIEVSRPYRQHDTSYVFNEYGGNVDFRVEGDTDTNLLFTDASSDRVGIGTNNPLAKLHNDGSDVIPFDKIYEKDFYVNFTNGAANQKVDLIFDNSSSGISGHIEIELTSGWSNQNAGGKIKKVIGFLSGSGGTIYVNEGSYTEVIGYTSINFAISDLIWDSTRSKYIIKIVHRVSTGNELNIKLRVVPVNDTVFARVVPVSLSSVYTTDTTSYDQPYVSFSDRVGIGTASPTEKLDVRYPVGGGVAIIKSTDSTDGVLLGDIYGANTAYQGLSHVDFSSTSSYMIMSEGTNTLISADTGGNVYIRGGPNNSSNEIRIYPATSDGIVINEQGADSNFRIEGDTDPVTFFVDAGVNSIGIGTSTPSAKLNVENGNVIFNDLGGNYDFRVEGDTLDHLLHTDASKDEVVIHNAIGYGLNYATSEGWVQATGTPTTSQVGYYGGNFESNGAAENYVDYSDLPNGLRGLVWQSRDNGTDNSTDGGWYKLISGLDPNKTYISIVYFRRVGSSTTGTFYHGCKGNDTINLNGTTNSNPYFHSWNMTNFPQDVWCVSIGIIHANNDTISANSGFGGIYRLDTGEKIYNFSTDYKMAASATIQAHRTYLYYDAVGDTDADWCWPGFYEVTADSIVNLLNTILYDHFSGRNITINEGGGNYDFRVEGDTDANLLFTDASTDRIGISTAGPDVKLQVNESAAHDNNYVYDTNGLMVVHPTPTSNTILNDPKEIFYIVREGTSAQAFGAAASFSLSRYENSATNSRTRLDIDLAHGAFLGSKTNVMTMRSDGNVGIGTSTPAHKLDVNGTFSANSININDQFTFPTTDGSSGQALVTNGSGVVSWTDVASGSANLTRGSFEVTSTQSTFTVSGGYTLNTLSVYYNGVKLLLGTDFTATNGTTFTLTNAAVSGDIVEYWALNSASSAVGNTSTGSVSVTSNQSVFSVANGYTVGGLIVFANGVKLVDGVDFTATNGSSFTLTSTATSGDVVDYIAYGAVVASSNLQKTGDTMTGNLTVNADLLIGSGNSLTIGQGGSDSFTFPTGDGSANQIIETDGSGNLSWVNKPQVVTNVYTGKTTYSVATAGNLGTYIAVLNTSITPTKSSSKIRVELNITFEITHNTIFRLFRSINGGADTEVVRNDDGNYWSGWAIPGYDANDTSTPRTNHHIYIDSPNTTLPITYKFMIQSAGDPASTFYLNRSIGYAGSSQAENGISQVILTEIPQ